MSRKSEIPVSKLSINPEDTLVEFYRDCFPVFCTQVTSGTAVKKKKLLLYNRRILDSLKQGGFDGLEESVIFSVQQISCLCSGIGN